jgi:hypothetical protein
VPTGTDHALDAAVKLLELYELPLLLVLLDGLVEVVIEEAETAYRPGMRHHLRMRQIQRKGAQLLTAGVAAGNARCARFGRARFCEVSHLRIER